MDPQKQQILLQNIKLYDSALAAWEKKDFAEARRLLKEMKAQNDVETLPAFLLEAYIERDSGRPVCLAEVILTARHSSWTRHDAPLHIVRREVAVYADLKTRRMPVDKSGGIEYT